ncbi:hypothetical protein [Deinococcus sonorensis]|uniref:Uncharacterized protein n=2 Tax=Deinococcus sonorensis TaxID=309891 RepID=A0AAU7U5Z0_9DEIO
MDTVTAHAAPANSGITLTVWLESATADLAPPAAKHLTEALRAHVQDAIEAGLTEAQAVRDMGDLAAAARQYVRSYLAAGWSSLSQIYPMRFGPFTDWLPLLVVLIQLVPGTDSHALPWAPLGVLVAWLVSVPLTHRLDGSLRSVVRGLIGAVLAALTSGIGGLQMHPLTWSQGLTVGFGVLGSAISAVVLTRYLAR